MNFPKTFNEDWEKKASIGVARRIIGRALMSVTTNSRLVLKCFKDLNSRTESNYSMEITQLEKTLWVDEMT